MLFSQPDALGYTQAWVHDSLWRLAEGDAAWHRVLPWATAKARQLMGCVEESAISDIITEADSVSNLIAPIIRILELRALWGRRLRSASGKPQIPDIILVDPRSGLRVAFGEAKRTGTALDPWAESLKTPWGQLRTYAEILHLPLGFLTTGIVWRLFHFPSSRSPRMCVEFKIHPLTTFDTYVLFAALYGREGLKSSPDGTSFTNRVVASFVSGMRPDDAGTLRRGAEYLRLATPLGRDVRKIQRLYSAFQYDAALECIADIERITSDPIARGSLTSLRGEVYVRQGDYPEASRHYALAREHFIQIGDEIGYWDEHRHLALVESRLGKPDASLKMLLEAFRNYTRIRHTGGMSSVLIGLGPRFAAMGEYEKGRAFVADGMALRGGGLDPISHGNVFLELARADMRVGNTSDAFKHAREAFRQYRKLPSLRGMRLALKELGRARPGA